ncbi:MAG: PspC domain-containing protein [Bacteroidetes bacterium]|nr:PspC domain-containing protein [Bacteroidota bacterium]
MKKVININFQGRVIPIEDSAYDILKQYVDSLRKFFAKEEGGDEIINDIEGRIAELFSESLKKGNTCVTDETVNGIIASMGRPEDFESNDPTISAQTSSNSKQADANYSYNNNEFSRGRLYRDDNDKLLGGVCSGIANYLRIDQTIVRLFFALLVFGFGTGIMLYLILWIVLPSKHLQITQATKRLYRNPDERVIAGVASGIAAYFDIAIWIPRLVFAIPLISGIFSGILRHSFWFDEDRFSSFLYGSFGGSLFVVYAILWWVIPEANSASEKLEMRGEKVDLNTIKNTIQEDLEGFKNRAEKWSGELGAKAKEFKKDFSQTVSEKSQQFGGEVKNAAKKNSLGIFKIIGFIFKAFFLLIAGVISFALLLSLIALVVAAFGAFPGKNFFLEGYWQNMLAWTTLALFIGVPIMALFSWLIRQIMGMKSAHKAVGISFVGLWVIGLISAIVLLSMITENFNASARDKQDYSIAQPSTGKLYVSVPENKTKVIRGWMKINGVLSMNKDSLVINNIQVHIRKSSDSNYHITATQFSSGSDELNALNNIKEMNYDINQQDSNLYLHQGFSLKKGNHFRNQGVVLNIQVPIGKRIVIDNSVRRRLNHFSINTHNDWDLDTDWEESNRWNSGTEYIMTNKGLKQLNQSNIDNNNDDHDGDNKVIEDYKKSKIELQKEYERKRKEAEELKKELDKPLDTTQSRYKKVVSYTAPGLSSSKLLSNELLETSKLLLMKLVL